MAKKKAVVVLSGGQDSTTCLGWALKYYDELMAVTFDYGQKHRIEVDAAATVLERFRNTRVDYHDSRWIGRGIPHEIIKFPEGFFAGTSPLTNSSEKLETYTDHKQMEKVIGNRVEKTFVPMRNAVFLCVAANRAAAAGYSDLITGICQADNANYPDCTEAFAVRMQWALSEAIGGELNIVAPLINRDKADSIRLAYGLGNGTYEALAYSHTAYDGQYPPTGKDHASVLRAHGFEQASMPDPLVVRAWREGLMELPDTPNYDNVDHWLPPTSGAGAEPTKKTKSKK